MKNLAPEIFRQRLLIEGFFNIEVTREVLANYLKEIAEHLEVRSYGEAVIFSPSSGMGKEENQGFDAFLPLIDSGISAYIWSYHKFFSIFSTPVKVSMKKLLFHLQKIFSGRR